MKSLLDIYYEVNDLYCEYKSEFTTELHDECLDFLEIIENMTRYLNDFSRISCQLQEKWENEGLNLIEKNKYFHK